MSDSAWYLNCRREDVGDCAILVGDRGRVRRIADRLDDVAWLNEDRGLTTATGSRGDRRITVSAFGMGAPIAAVVLHELRQLGIAVFLRLGTIMSLEPVALGDLVIADAAIRGEATSGTYVPEGFPAAGDHDLGARLRAAADDAGRRWHAGLVDSADGFYTEMLGADGRFGELRRLGVLGLDMETSAVLAIGRALGARAASVCVATVDARSRRRLAEGEREAAEDALVQVGLDALLTLDPVPTDGGSR